MKRLARTWTLTATAAVLATVILTPVQAQSPTYERIEVEPLVAPDGVEMRFFRFTAFNSAGQVAGTAFDRQSRFAAFRFTPGKTTENIDPKGNFTSWALQMNERGQVYGIEYDFRIDHEGQREFITERTDHFLASDGVDAPGMSATRQFRERFHLIDMNDHGDLVGYVSTQRPEGFVAPFLYTKEGGWVNLGFLDRRLINGERGSYAKLINNRGDIVLTTNGSGKGWNSYVLPSGVDDLVALRHFKTFRNSPGSLNDTGQMSGIFGHPEQERAYFYSPDKGIVKIHPRRFAQSAALYLNAEGVAAGILWNKGWDSLFTYDERRSRKLEIVATRADFRNLFPQGTRFKNLEVTVQQINERLDVIGTAYAEEEIFTNVEMSQVPYYYSEATGLISGQELIERIVPDHTLSASIVMLNDLGHLFVRLEESEGDGRYVILRPQR